MSKKTTKKSSKKASKKASKKTTKKSTSKSSSNIIESGDFIKLEFTGRIKDTGAIFSSSDEETAKKAGIYDEKSKYGPIPLVAGQSFLLPGLDRQIIGLEVGKSSTVLVPSAEAYGPRQESLIQTFPAKRIKESGIKLKKGEKVRNKNQLGVIVGIKQGRVHVDFNHELAGKDLEFEVNILEKVEEQSSKIFLLVSRYIAALKEEDFSYDANEDEKSINLNFNLFLLLTEGFQNVALRLMSDLRQNFNYQKIEFRFAFDYSEIAKEEKKLEETMSAPVTPSEDSEKEDKETESEIEA